MRSRRRSLALPALVIACFLALTGQASAATQRLWSGAADTGVWSDAGNWVNGVPQAGDGVTFNSPSTSTDDLAAAISNILFTSTAGGSTVGGTVHINAVIATINIASNSDGNRIDAAIAITNATLFVKSATAGQKLTLAGAISGTAGLGVRVYGPGVVEYAQSSNNTYPGTTTVASNDPNGGAGQLQLSSLSAGALVPGNLTIGGTASGQPANSASVKLITRDDIADASIVSIARDGLLDLNDSNETVASVALSDGNVTQGAGSLTAINQVGLNGGSITSTTGTLKLASSAFITATSATTPAVVTAPIHVSAVTAVTLPITVAAGTTQPELTLGSITATSSPTISVAKSGSGELRLNGESTYTGNTDVNDGALSLATGASLSSSAVNVTGGAALRGLGTSGVVTVAGGVFAPGASGAPGAYAVTGGLALSALSAFDVDVTSAGSSAASATGSIALGNSALHLDAAPDYVAPAHAKLRIIDNLGSGPIGGTFAGLPEGSSVALGGKLFTLSYIGGTGNDAELTVPNTAPILAAGASAGPSPGVAGAPVTLSAAAADADGDALTYAWTFGDGTTGTGATTTHTYSAPGQYAVSVAISDGFGGSLSSATTVTVDPAPPGSGPSGTAPPVAPTLTHFAQTHAKWRAGQALAVFATAAKRAPVGTRLSFTLDEAATVSLTFTQSATGRRSGKRCVAQAPKNRSAKSCKRTLTLGTIKHAGRSGRNVVTFQARLSSAKLLRPGRYTVTATAADAHGARSKPSALRFTIVR